MQNWPLYLRRNTLYLLLKMQTASYVSARMTRHIPHKPNLERKKSLFWYYVSSLHLKSWRKQSNPEYFLLQLVILKNSIWLRIYWSEMTVKFTNSYKRTILFQAHLRNPWFRIHKKNFHGTLKKKKEGITFENGQYKSFCFDIMCDLSDAARNSCFNFCRKCYSLCNFTKPVHIQKQLRKDGWSEQSLLMLLELSCEWGIIKFDLRESVNSD